MNALLLNLDHSVQALSKHVHIEVFCMCVHINVIICVFYAAYVCISMLSCVFYAILLYFSWSLVFYFIYLFCACVATWACTRHSMCVEIRAQHAGVVSLLSPRGAWELNSVYQALANAFSHRASSPDPQFFAFLL